MNGENRTLVTNEPVEFEKLTVQNFGKITLRLGGIYKKILQTNEVSTKRSQHVTNWTSN